MAAMSALVAVPRKAWVPGATTCGREGERGISEGTTHDITSISQHLGIDEGSVDLPIWAHAAVWSTLEAS